MRTAKPATVSSEDMIRALMADKFAAAFELGDREHRDMELVVSRSARGAAKHNAYREDMTRAIQRYTAHLKRLSRSKLEDAFREMQAEAARRSPDHERLFFNEPFAAADNAYWASQPTWSMEEAAALLLRKDPDIVNLLSQDTFLGTSLAANFDKLLYGLQQAKEDGEFSEHVAPSALLEWADAQLIEFPSELAQSVMARHPRLRPSPNARGARLGPMN